MRGRRLHRLFQLIALLRGPSSWNARRLAEHFHTSRRNIHRDLAVLELAGVPFWYDPEHGEGGGYRIRESFFFPCVGLTDQECFDLAVITRLVENQGIPLVNEVCHVRDKLFETLPTRQQVLITEASGLYGMLNVCLADPERCRQTMLAVQKALLLKRQIEGSYCTSEKDRPARVWLQPRRVFLCNNAWYVAAHDNEEGQTKLYRISGFQGVKVLDTPLTVSPHFSLREFLGNAWAVQRGTQDYRVEILFDPEARPLVEEFSWHHTQGLECRRDGSLVFRATVSGLDEIKHWVLGWGPRARVLKPKSLAEEVERLAQETLNRYRRPESGRRSGAESD